MQNEESIPKTTDEIMDDLRRRTEDLKKRLIDTNERIKDLNAESRKHLDDMVNEEA